jgi:hypothetical protein
MDQAVGSWLDFSNLSLIFFLHPTQNRDPTLDDSIRTRQGKSLTTSSKALGCKECCEVVYYIAATKSHALLLPLSLSKKTIVFLFTNHKHHHHHGEPH